MPNDDESNWGRYLGLGLEMAVGTFLGMIVGRWIDKRFGWSPWGVVCGSMLGLAAGMYLLLKEAMRLNK
jgi:F0F1-type ATP synthase assembly protein I